MNKCQYKHLIYNKLCTNYQALQYIGKDKQKNKTCKGLNELTRNALKFSVLSKIHLHFCNLVANSVNATQLQLLPSTGSK